MAISIFICLHEHYVNAFLAVKEGSDEELPIMAIIKTSIDHELGHWIFTLVSVFPLRPNLRDSTNPRVILSARRTQ